jgi:type II secretory pathway pseudopilin PulG
MRENTASSSNKGFTYIGLLLFIGITGVGLSVAGMSWQYQVRAEKEKQLLFVGSEFRDAINSYYASSPNAAKVYPVSLNDLLLDKRMPNIKRHLRKVYLDPMTGKLDWGLVTQQGRIVGIYSRSNLVPYKQQGFNMADAKMVGVKSYQEWVFGNNESNEQKPSANSALASSMPANQSSSNNNSSLAAIQDPLKTPKDTNPPYSKDEAKAKEILSPGEQDLYNRYYR